VPRFSVYAGETRRSGIRRGAFAAAYHGAHVIGPHTEELINVFSPAIRANIAIGAEGFFFAYPTASSDISSLLE
jgi:pyruvate/2-oxoglutarate dehydrogenase complex dihydrolipoamide dehydrogenase (E3) component